MHHISRVQKVNRTKHIIHHRLHMFLRKLARVHIRKDRPQVLLKVFHHNEDVIKLFVLGLARNDNIDQLRRKQISLHPA